MSSGNDNERTWVVGPEGIRPPYQYSRCVICGGRIVNRPRCPEGPDYCENGHSYTQAERAELIRSQGKPRA